MDHFSVTSQDSVLGSTVEDAVQSALENVKTWRATLATATQGYLAACNNLNFQCAQPCATSAERMNTERVLATLDTELDGLALEQRTIDQAKSVLSITRNCSRSLAPIHNLPPEVLRTIFSILPLWGRSNARPVIRHAPTIAEVSTYWRKVIIRLKHVWSYLRIPTRSGSYEPLEFLAERSDGYPLHLDISGSLPYGDMYQDNLARRLDFISRYSTQIGQIKMYHNREEDTGSLQDTLMCWFKTGFKATGKAFATNKTLVLSGMVGGSIPTEWPANIFLDQTLETEMEIITGLHLTNISIPWESRIYSGLVDLQLIFHNQDRLEISQTKLADILGRCPELETLIIRGNLMLMSDNSHIPPVYLPKLKTLCIFDLSLSSYRFLLPLLSLSGCQSDLSVHLDLRNAAEMQDQVCKLVRDAPIKTFVCSNNRFETRLSWPFSLVPLMPLLENLVLVTHPSLTSAEINDLILEFPPKVDFDSHQEHSEKESPPGISHLYVVSSTAVLRDLRYLVLLFGVRNLHLERCTTPLDKMTVEEIKSSLLNSFPKLLCSISDDGTVEHLDSCLSYA
ncbi:hypothetical protein RhiJN_17176 [Ceratobasidium sp. AG-Ba]|nr:hypothetical protein RhiJN_17176 [Ceratobasidium sp. AG-Ba]